MRDLEQAAHREQARRLQRVYEQMRLAAPALALALIGCSLLAGVLLLVATRMSKPRTLAALPTTTAAPEPEPAAVAPSAPAPAPAPVAPPAYFGTSSV